MTFLSPRTPAIDAVLVTNNERGSSECQVFRCKTGSRRDLRMKDFTLRSC